jgi:hypothetical protein
MPSIKGTRSSRLPYNDRRKERTRKLHAMAPRPHPPRNRRGYLAATASASSHSSSAASCKIAGGAPKWAYGDCEGQSG